MADLALELPEVGGHILQLVQGEAEPGVIMAHGARFWFWFKGDFPLPLMDSRGARQTRHHFEIGLQISVDHTPDLRERQRGKCRRIAEINVSYVCYKLPAEARSLAASAKRSRLNRLATDKKTSGSVANSHSLFIWFST